MITFKSTNGDTSTTVKSKKEDMTVADLLELFGEFYRASGYCNDLEITIKGSFGGDVEANILGV